LISATGNVSGNYFIGNGSQLTGITGGGTPSAIVSGTSNVTVVSSGGNVTVGVGGTGNVAVFATTGEYVTGLISATGNITGGNILGGANVNATTHTGTTVSVTANITGGNVLTGGLISATANVTGGNVTTGGLTNTASLSVTGNTATVTTANYSIGYLNIPQISLSANSTVALIDSGKHFYSTSSSNLTLTLANNSSVSWPIGTAIGIVNFGTANVTVVAPAGVSLYLSGNNSSGNRIVTTYGMASLMNIAANTWVIGGTVT
jgi:hypothetical protein